MFNQIWIYIYPLPYEFMFNNVYELKKGFVPLIKDLSIKPVCTTVNNPQNNALLEWMHQVIYNMLVMKDIDNK